MTSRSISRRRFIVVVGSTGVAVVAGCSDDGEATAPSTTSPVATTSTAAEAASTVVSSEYWGLLREARTAIQESPDAIEHELDRLAARGDIDGLLAFVTRTFAVVPRDPAGWIAPSTSQRWGVRGLVRSRTGTHREVAQLLAEVLTRNSVAASVVALPLLDSVRPGLTPTTIPPFAPSIAVDALEAAAGTEPREPAPPLDIERAAAVGRAVVDALSMDFFDPPPPPALSGQGLPGVEIEGGRVLDPWSTSPSTIESGRTLAAEPGAAPTASFRVEITTDRAPTRPVEVAALDVPLDVLAGRRVDIRFVPPVSDLASLLTTRPADVTTFVPVLSVEGTELPEPVAVSGDPITIEGDVMTDDGDGFALGRGQVRGGGDPGSVAEVTVDRIETGRWPRLRAAVDLRDASGARVERIGADALRVTDGGVPVPVLIRRTEPAPPSVVFIVDNSSSVPEQFRNQGATRVVGEIAGAVKAGQPLARFRVANVGGEGAARLPWRDDPSVVADDADQFGLGSALWQSYVDAVAEGGTVVVFLTDGVAIDRAENPIDDAPPELVAALRAGPPAIMVGAGELGAAFAGIAAITGGATVATDDQEVAIATVLAEIEARRVTHELLVLADEDGAPGVRSLEVTVGAAAGALDYDVPRGEETQPGPTLAGIHLSIVANGVTVTRTLAGVRLGEDVTTTPELTDEMHQALFGSYSVIAEAGAPTPAQQLDELIETALTWEPFFTATDDTERIAAFAAGRDLPFGRFTFAAPISGPDLLTWETGLRMWLSTERRIPTTGGDGVIRRSVDLLPVSRFVTAASDPAVSIRRTAERTTWLSGLEAALFDTAALDHLESDLIRVDPTGLDADDRARFERLSAGGSVYSGYAAPPGLEVAAAADRVNGTVIALLPDGSGGAQTEESIKTSFKQVIALVEMGETAGAPAAWAKLEKAKLERLRFATLVIFRMSVEGIIKTLEEEACSRLNKKITAWTKSSITSLDGDAGSLLGFVEDHAKLVKRYGDAAGLAPDVPTKLKLC